MKHPIPSNTTEPLKVGDRVQIVPAWQDSGDEKFERFVIEAPGDTTQVRIRTLIPSFPTRSSPGFGRLPAAACRCALTGGDQARSR